MCGASAQKLSRRECDGKLYQKPITTASGGLWEASRTIASSQSEWYNLISTGLLRTDWGKIVTLVIALKSKDGILLGADSCRSRVNQEALDGKQDAPLYTLHSDAQKLFSLPFPHSHIGLLVAGMGSIGERSIHQLLEQDFAPSLPARRLSIQEYAENLHAFFSTALAEILSTGSQMAVIEALIAGYNGDNGEVWVVNRPHLDTPQLLVAADQYDYAALGDYRYLARIRLGIDPELNQVLGYLYQTVMEKQLLDKEMAKKIEGILLVTPMHADCQHMDRDQARTFLRFFFDTTITAQQWDQAVHRGVSVGYPLHFAFITPIDGLVMEDSLEQP